VTFDGLHVGRGNDSVGPAGFWAAVGLPFVNHVLGERLVGVDRIELEVRFGIWTGREGGALQQEIGYLIAAIGGYLRFLAELSP
jgi:hypothetical protein